MKKVIDAENLPKWVRNLLADTPPRQEPQLWTVDETGDTYHAWVELGSFHRAELTGKKAPYGVDPASIVDWYDLPAWVKGSYTNEEEMRRLQSYTWSKGSESTYFAYEPNGRYAGIWERE